MPDQLVRHCFYRDFAMFRGYVLNAFICIGVCVGFCMQISAQPPKVAVDVATAATEANKVDQPILPDDYGKQEAGSVMATWSRVDIPVTGYVVPGVTLYTSDTIPCAPCKVQERILINAGGMKADGTPVWPFKIVRTDERSVPAWVPDNGDAEMLGAREANSLKAWIFAYTHAPAGAPAKNYPSSMVVTVDSASSHAVIMALAESLRRTSDTQPAVSGFLPAIPIDVDDSLLKVLDALLGAEGYQSGSLSVKWPSVNRKVTFEPGITLAFKKIIEVDATVTAISIKGRDVTLYLSGTILKELTVRLK